MIFSPPPSVWSTSRSEMWEAEVEVDFWIGGVEWMKEEEEEGGVSEGKRKGREGREGREERKSAT